MGKLSDAKIRALVRAKKPVAGISDGEGLTFTLSRQGTASWVLRFRLGGRPRELTLGNYPDMPLMAARRAAAAARVRVDQGVDVATDKRERIRAAVAEAGRQSFQELAEDWYRRMIEGRVKYPEVVHRVLRRHVYPVIGRESAADVTPEHIDRVITRVVDAGARTVANDVLRHLVAICAHGVKRRQLPHNPAAAFTIADAGGPEKSRSRALSRDEIAALFQAMKATPNLGRDNYLTFLVLLATCVRKGEFVAARWAEFDLERGVWSLPADRTKTGQPLDIPLAAAVVTWLRELQVFAAGSEYVLPARIQRSAKRQRFPHISPDTLNVALGRVKHALDHFTIHDMRRTARTQLAALGITREVAERALNHALKDVEGIYNRHDYFEERKQALTLWADLLVSLESGKARSVVPLAERRKA
jgi:integrase